MVTSYILVLRESSLNFSLGWYIVFMSLFHYLEYLVTALTNPLNLNTDSFLLNHSVAYGVAATAGLTEYFIEMWLYPGEISSYPTLETHPAMRVNSS